MRRLLPLTTVLVLALALSGTAQTPPLFEDKTRALGLSLGTDAVCWADLDNDTFPELITSSGVWRNDGSKRFTRWEAMGNPGTVIAADYDNDGFTDVFALGAVQLFHNEHGTALKPVALPALPRTVCRGACWGDFNGDGFVDLYIGGYEDWDAGITFPSLILLNQGGKSITLARTESQWRTRGATACDWDSDGDLDIYVSNYRLQPNQLWRNDGKGQFTDVAARANALATDPGFDGGHSIGACWGDFDNDGLFDLFAGNFAHQDDRGDQPKSRFLRNLGPRQDFAFEDHGTCGIFYQESYATPAAGDYDNDGRLDLIFTTVYGTASFGRPNFPVLFHNDGRFVFSDRTAASGVANLPPTYQAAWTDFDGDGDLDLACGGKLFVNRGMPGTHWLEVRLIGDGVRVNRDAIGAQVRVMLADGSVLTRQVEAGTGEGNQNDLRLHFGLGSSATPVALTVHWPDGTRQSANGLRPDHHYRLDYKKMGKRFLRP